MECFGTNNDLINNLIILSQLDLVLLFFIYIFTTHKFPVLFWAFFIELKSQGKSSLQNELVTEIISVSFYILGKKNLL